MSIVTWMVGTGIPIGVVEEPSALACAGFDKSRMDRRARSVAGLVIDCIAKSESFILKTKKVDAFVEFPNLFWGILS